MSIAIMTRVWKEAPVAGSDLLVLLALADSAGDDDLECYPSIAHLAQKSRLSEKQVGRVLKHLRDLELIEVKTQGAAGRGRVRAGHVPNLYRICPENWQAAELLLSTEGTPDRGDTQDPRTPPAYVPPTGDTQDPQNHQSDSSLESSIPRKRKNPTPVKPKNATTADILIQAWAEACGYDGADIGATYATGNRKRVAREMLKWTIPVTCEEITDYIHAIIESGKEPPEFIWLPDRISLYRGMKTAPQKETKAQSSMRENLLKMGITSINGKPL